MVSRITLLAAISGALILGCKDPEPGTTDTATGTGSSTSTATMPTSVDPPTTDGTDAMTTIVTTDGTTGTPDTTSGGSISGSTTSPTTGETTMEATTGPVGPCKPLACDGKTFACGDCMDNDGDGKIDLNDPECISPCDDREDTFATGLPGDNMDACKQDCFFDGNSGQGDDGCIWDLRCDPENPGANVGCEYTGGNNCNNQPPNQDEDCIMFCEQYVPPGCDCFGCCEVETPDGPVHIFLNSGPDCSLANLDACQSCTYQIDDCGTPCEPEMCELCFGQDELPEGCDDNMCEIGDPCDSEADCPTDFYCLLGCCYPPPPG